MFKINKSKFLSGVALVILGLQSSCNSSGGSSSGAANGGVVAGNLSFNYNGSLPITNGSLQQVYLQLNNSRGVTGQDVLITVDDPTVAKVSPSVCTLTTDAPYCAVTVYGLKDGSATLNARASGYTTQSVLTNVGNSPVYGYLAVESSITLNPTSMESGSNINIKFSSYQAINGNYTINVTGGLLFSSGITTASNAYFHITPNSPILGGANQCQVTTTAPTCTLSFQVPESAITQTLTLAATIVGNITTAHNYPGSTLTALADDNAYPGTVQITTQTSSAADPSNATIPVNMNAPLFVNWNNVAMDGTISVALTSSNPSVVSFYTYTPGDNINIQTAAATNCTLIFPTTLSCGLGIRALSTGSAVISAIATASNQEIYTITSLNLTVAAQAAATRTVIFTNNSSESMAIGITSGGANAYISPTQPAVIPGSPGANLKPGGGSQCGPTNPLAACPIGSTCLQGGESPVPSSVYYCYYDAPSPSCGSNCSKHYLLAAGGSTTLSISDSSGASDPTGIIWSGNYFARTHCNESSGICQNASCNGKAGGLACGPGTGGSPGVNTLAEVTFQRAHVDFYDVSIINGLNFAAAFGPTTTPPLASNAYICGTAGSAQAQSGGWSESTQNSSGLPAALWATAPNAASFPSPVAVGSESSYYRWVEYSGSAISCNAESDCSAPAHCGYWIGTAFNRQSGEDFINESDANYTKHCGSHIAWVTADSIFGLNQTGTNLVDLPFNFTTYWTNPVPNSPIFSVGDLQLCINNAFSSYGNQPTPESSAGNPILACGGVDWAQVGITRVAQPVVTIGTNWVTNVLPTITWLKSSCPTCYTYPFDDMSSTFTCQGSSSYSVTFSDFIN